MQISITALVAVGALTIGAAGCDTGNRRGAEARTQNREREGTEAVASCDCDRAATADGDRGSFEGRGWRAPRGSVFETADTFNQEHRQARPASASRPKSKAHIDVELKSANLADALRFLASAGGFNLVTDENLGAPVTVDLHDVDPYDALVVIAESQGLEVDYSRGIVRVGAAKPASSQNTAPSGQ